MKVGINATSLNDRPSGAKQRFLGIYGALFFHLPETEFFIYEPSDCSLLKWFQGHPNVSFRKTPIPSLGRWGKFYAGLGYWRESFARDSFDIFEAMHLPFVRPKEGVALLTIHDVRGLYSKNSRIDRIIFAKVLRHALKRADHIVTVSAAMRDEILAFYPHTPVSVVHNGLKAEAFSQLSQTERDVLCEQYRLPDEFLLAVGHFEGRKNYRRLIDVMGLLKQRGLNCPLVIVGNDSGERDTLLRQVDSLGLNGDVKLLTGLSDRAVACLYNMATLFVFPSVYEGFGIPILEAMASGCPMVLSDLPVFREITQNQSIYFNPRDLQEMANSIEIGLSATGERHRMIQYGFQRVQDFSFERLALTLAGVYRKYH